MAKLIRSMSIPRPKASIIAYRFMARRCGGYSSLGQRLARKESAKNFGMIGTIHGAGG